MAWRFSYGKEARYGDDSIFTLYQSRLSCGQALEALDLAKEWLQDIRDRTFDRANKGK
jgi:hypothetical protein